MKPRLFALLLLAVAPAAFAQADAPPAQGYPDPMPVPPSLGRSGPATTPLTFSQLDKNGDGKLGSSEAGVDAKLSARFTQLDANKDGTLSRTEFTAFVGG